MTKHDPKLAPLNDIDADLLRRTETAILAFMAENDGQMPTQQKVNEAVGTSFNRLGPAVRTVKDRLMATQTQLANMPEIPDKLRLAHDQMLKDLWTKTRDLQNGEIVDLRRAQTAKDADYRRDRAETHEIITYLETRCDDETSRADVAEAALEEMRAEQVESAKSLATAQARLSERDSILEMLGAKVASLGEDDATKKPGSRAKKSPAKIQPEEAERFSLPGITESAPPDGPSE
jgi:hypothetical protein